MSAIEISCIVCFDPLSGISPVHYPCNLNCGHSNLHVCCARELVVQGNIKCPQCLALTPCARASSIPVNITLRSLLEDNAKELKKQEMRQNKSSKIKIFRKIPVEGNVELFSEIICENPDAVCNKCATKFCSNCELSFCEDCSISTHAMKIFTSHRMCSVRERIPTCVEHPNCLLNKICLEHQMLICAECQVQEHLTHNVKTIESVAQQEVQNLLEPLTQLQHIIGNHQNSLLLYCQEVESHAQQALATTLQRSDVVGNWRSEIRIQEQVQINQCREVQNKLCEYQTEILVLFEQIENENIVSLLEKSLSHFELQVKLMTVKLIDDLKHQCALYSLSFKLNLEKYHDESISPNPEVELKFDWRPLARSLKLVKDSNGNFVWF